MKSGAPLFTTLHHSSPGYFFIGLRWVNRAFLLHGLRTDSVRRLSSVRRPSGFAIRCKKMFDLWNRGICNPPSIYKQLAKKSGVKSGEESSALFTLPKQLIHKHLRHSGEGWRVFLKLADNRYKLQRITNPQRKGRTFFNSGLQIRWDASRKKGRFKINICPPADFHLHNRCWASAYQLLCKRTTAVVRLER